MKKPSGSSSQSDVVPLRFDGESGEFWKGEERLRLSRKPFAMLRLLVESHPKWVSKDDFYNQIWKPKDEDVMDWTFTTYVHEIRRALGDEAKPHRYIETGTNKGYRFIGLFTESDQRKQSSAAKTEAPPDRPSRLPFVIEPIPQLPLPYVVGRKTEEKKLHGWLDRALTGDRQLVFITGEPGIGKTTLVRTFLREVAKSGTAVIGRGQCIEHYGSGEAYLPVLEAFGRLARDPRGSSFVEWMRQYAPTWLAQMPTLLTPTDLEEVQRKVQGATRERMLREMSEGIEILTEQIPLILVLEDLHWSDASTLDLLSSLARRIESARLLLIGTYRPEEGLAEGHPLRSVSQELQGHRLCQEIALSPLTEANVSEYLQQRFPTATLPTRLPEVLYRKTEGSPLFLAAVVDDLLERGVIKQDENRWELQGEVDSIVAETPVSIRQLFTRQIDRLSEKEQQIVQAASVAGQEFSCAAVAAAIGTDIAQVEECCAVLARRQQFLRPAGYNEWPDGTRAARYGFRHALYQYLWNERIPVARRQQLHIRIGERLEQAYGTRAREIAAELAVHFEEGRDYGRAVRYLQQAAQNALRRSANAEAIRHLSQGVTLLQALPNDPWRTQKELELQITLGSGLMMAKGYGAPEAARSYARARELCHHLEETPQLASVLQGLGRFYTMRAEYPVALELTEQRLNLAVRLQDKKQLLDSRQTLGLICFHQGEFARAHAHFEHVRHLGDPYKEHASTTVYNPDFFVTYLAMEPLTLWMLGYSEQAMQHSRRGLELVRELGRPYSLAFVLSFAAWLSHCYRDWVAVQAHAEELLRLATTQDFSLWVTQGKYWLGWIQGEHGKVETGLSRLQDALTAWQATGAELGLPFYLSGLAEAYRKASQPATGLTVVAKALTSVDGTDERFWEGELYRLQGELFLQSQAQGLKDKARKDSAANAQSLESEGESSFLKAIQIAHRQNAKSLELRAAVSLAKLWQRQGKSETAQRLLSDLYNQFTEGFDTADLRDAKVLLAELAKGACLSEETSRKSGKAVAEGSMPEASKLRQQKRAGAKRRE